MAGTMMSREMPRSRSRARRAARSMSTSALLRVVGAGELDLHDGAVDPAQGDGLGAPRGLLHRGDLDGEGVGTGGDEAPGDLATGVVHGDQSPDVALEVPRKGQRPAHAGRGDL